MKFEWDEKKSKSNLTKHKVSFEKAKEIFSDPFHLTIDDDGHSNDEDRFVAIGQTVLRELVVLVVGTYRTSDNAEIIRIISARKATPKEKRAYFNRRG